jgi:hypothetical protein
MNRYLAETNDNPKPFTWTADPDRILAAVKRGKEVLESIHQPRWFLVRRFSSTSSIKEPNDPHSTLHSNRLSRIHSAFACVRSP